MMLVLWIEGVFSHGLGVCHIVYGVWVVIEQLCPSPFLFLCVVPFGTYLDDYEDIDFLVEFASCFCKSVFNGYVINKTFERLYNVIGNFSVLYKKK